MEIERKFIFNDKFFNYDLNLIPHYEIEQYYLSFNPEIRLRKRAGENTNCFITIKSVGGLERNEFEENIPLELFDRLKEKRVSKIISKTRYILNLDGYCFEIDYYKDHLEGLKVVEIRLILCKLKFKWFEFSCVTVEIQRVKNSTVQIFLFFRLLFNKC